MASKNLVGLDIGSKFTKIVQLKEKSGVKFLINAQLISTPQDLNMEDSVAMKDFLSLLATSNNLKNKPIAYALNISECIARYLTIPMVDESEIEQAIMWEAEQYIPFKLDKVNVNYQILNIDQKNKNIKVLIVAAKKEKIEFLKEVFSKAKLKLECVDVDIFSTINTYLENAPEKNKLVFILNVGAKSTKLALLDSTEPIYFSYIDFSLDSIVLDIASKLSISESESLNMLLSKDKDPHLISIIESNLINLQNELSNVLNFNFSLIADRHIDNFVLAGGACSIDEIATYLATVFNIGVIKLNPFETLTIQDPNFNIDNKYLFDVALGLALRKA
ncbi:type IV pilus assembly protein PilM [Desulfurella multipotens]|uniref:Type IV pilus assembly protein PilM n=1 Tax=Desulfurella multipotens TaxID=79269 RepID=A0A1G6I149_9BACT|nr:type IV pilus assembly protein PilM [Desulfurella multipotens]SDC00181.1 type IV pilus assembly protein PilM [Desulfurella multipotens]